MFHVLTRFLGQDKSQEFISSLPHESFGRLIWQFLKAMLILTCSFLLLLFIVFLIHNAFSLELDEFQWAAFLTVCLLPGLVFATVRYFYNKSFVAFKTHFTSIKLIAALKHAVLIELFIGLVAYVAFTVYYVFNKVDLLYDLTQLKLLVAESESSQTPFIADLILAVLLWFSVGFIEEVLFRGIGYRLLRKKLSRFLSIILSSLIFMAIHPFGVIKWPIVFIAAVAFSFYFEYKNNLLTPVLAHMLQDFMIAGVVAFGSTYTAKYLLGI